jgi:hypothetical protein
VTIVSSLSSEEMAYHFSEPGKLSRYTPPHQKSMAAVVQTKARRHAKCPPGRQIPGRDRRDVLRGIVQSHMVAVAEGAVHFNAGREILGAKTAPIRRRLQRQRAAGAQAYLNSQELLDRFFAASGLTAKFHPL